MPYEAPNLAGLTLNQIADLASTRKLPPVAQWNPEKAGESEMRIAADGQWYHQGGLIRRPAMVRAFSSLLKLDDDGDYWLVTPHEKLHIDVEDAPFLAVELTSEGELRDRSLALRLNTDDLVIINSAHPIAIRHAIPYVAVRDGLWAKCARAVYYDLAEIALAEASDPAGVWSRGVFFPIENSA